METGAQCHGAVAMVSVHTKDRAVLTHCASHTCPDFPHCLQPSSSPSFEPSPNQPFGAAEMELEGNASQWAGRTQNFWRVSEGGQQDGKGFIEHEEQLRSLGLFGSEKRRLMGGLMLT